MVHCEAMHVGVPALSLFMHSFGHMSTVFSLATDFQSCFAMEVTLVHADICA